MEQSVTPLLELRDVSISFDGCSILDHINLSLRPGRSVSISSPSGPGKSTILSIAGLLLSPDSGQVLIDGVDALKKNDADRSRLRNEKIGFIFQHAQLVGSLRAWENVAVPASFAQDVQFDAEEKAKSLLKGLGLEERLDHYPFQLSFGQKRRVAIARALLLSPSIILADEPTNDLDSGLADSVAELLFSQIGPNRSLLLVTHDAELAARADEQYRLDAGKLVRVK